MQIVLCYETAQCHVDQIVTTVGDKTVIDAGQERIDREILNADIFCGHAKVPLPWEEVVRRGRLRWIQSSAAGLDHCLVPAVADSDILVTGASGLFADQVAEHTLALLTGLLRNLPTFFRAAQRHEFIRRPTLDLHGRTIGIIGFGGNGRRIAEILAPFRVRVLATDLYPLEIPKPSNVEAIWHADRLKEVLAQVDVVILCVPLTEKTRGMIDRRMLENMKPGSILVNVARGPVIVERHLVRALESGHLAGAGLDVTEIEPLPGDSPLWDLPNVIITPHVGAQSVKRVDDMTGLFCDNLQRYFSGRPLRNVVDKHLGFSVPTGSPEDD